MLRPRRLRSRVPASHQNRASASIWSPQNPESMPQDSLTHTQLGIPDSTPPESALSARVILSEIDTDMGGIARDRLEQGVVEIGLAVHVVVIGEDAVEPGGLERLAVAQRREDLVARDFPQVITDQSLAPHLRVALRNAFPP